MKLHDFYHCKKCNNFHLLERDEWEKKTVERKMTTNNNEFAQVIFNDYTNHTFPASSELIDFYEKYKNAKNKREIRALDKQYDRLLKSSLLKENRLKDPVYRQILMCNRYLSQGRQILFRSAALNERICFNEYEERGGFDYRATLVYKKIKPHKKGRSKKRKL